MRYDFNEINMQLPFLPLPYASGSPSIGQGYQTKSSHSGTLQWGIDFGLTTGSDVLAIMGGDIVAFRQSAPVVPVGTAGAGHGNYMTIRSVVNGETVYVTYSHLAFNFLNNSDHGARLGSAVSTRDQSDHPSSAQIDAQDHLPSLGAVSMGQVIGKTGLTGIRLSSSPEGNGEHLHIHSGTRFTNISQETIADGSGDATAPIRFAAFPNGPLGGTSHPASDLRLFRDAHNAYFGTNGYDFIRGTEADETFFPNGGTDAIDGAGGIDIVVLDVPREWTTLTRAGSTVLVEGPSFRYTLRDIDGLEFTTGLVAVALLPNQLTSNVSTSTSTFSTASASSALLLPDPETGEVHISFSGALWNEAKELGSTLLDLLREIVGRQAHAAAPAGSIMFNDGASSFVVAPEATTIVVVENGAEIGRVAVADIRSAKPADDHPDTVVAGTILALTGGGATVDGLIETRGDRDWFRADLVAGQTYAAFLSAAPGSRIDPFLKVRMPDGSERTNNDLAAGQLNAFLSFTATQSGSYAIEVTGVGNTSGRYGLSIAGITLPSAGPAPVAPTIPTAAVDTTPLNSAWDWEGTNGADEFGSSINAIRNAGFDPDSNLRLRGYANNDEIGGGDGDDVIWGDRGNDELIGWRGYDTLLGGDGRDSIYGGRDDDLVLGEDGNDQLAGDDGDDTVYGGNDNDLLTGGDHDDTLYGGRGNDTILGDDTAGSDSGDDYLKGESGDDLLYGGDFDDTLHGDEGNDTLFGGLSDDYLNGGANDDVLYGGEWADFILGEGGNDIGRGGHGRDSLFGGEGNDTLYGGDDHDFIAGEDGNDLLHGEEGNDSIYGGGGDDTLSGGRGDDILHGDSGIDTADFSEGTAGVAVNLFDEIARSADLGLDRLFEIENVVGSSGPDTIDGNHGANTIHGGAGDDRVRGHNDDDLIEGGAGDDTLWGDAGNDTIRGETGLDQLRGGLGDDVIDGGDGDDHLRGEQGNDLIHGGNGIDTAFFWGQRADLAVTPQADGSIIVSDLRIDAPEGRDTLHSVELLEFFDGVISTSDPMDAGPDAVDDFAETTSDSTVVIDVLSNDVSETPLRIGAAQVVSGGGSVMVAAGRVLFDPGNAFDYLRDGESQVALLSYTVVGSNLLSETGSVHVTVTGWARSVSGTDGPNEMIGDHRGNHLEGGGGDDTLHGLAGNDTLFGGEGNDLIFAGEGDDFVGGGAGNDTIRGSDGNDTIYGGLGDDNIGGGAGDDLIYGAAGRNTIWAGLGNDTVQGGSGSDTIYGGVGRNRLFGNEGDDLIIGGASGDLIGGGAGNDTIRGGQHNDTIYGGLGNDNIGGGAGNDVIFGSTGNNTIWGGVGNDTIVAGAGREVMNGGPGADVFMFNSAAQIGIGAARDVITDFQSGVDDIDLRALATTFNGTAGVLGGGQASFFYFAAGGLLIGDQNGNGAADWVLQLTGATTVTVGDFLL